MSNRRKLKRNPEPLADLLDQFAARRIPGGCPDCHAYQRLDNIDGIYHLRVYHDDTCPELARRSR